MKLTAHEEYGFRCLVQLGRHESLTIPEISSAEGISQAYVAKLLRTLRQSGFIKAARGKTGGDSLARSAGQNVVGGVLTALGGEKVDDALCGSPPRQADVFVP